jgi:hypothetical protein
VARWRQIRVFSGACLLFGCTFRFSGNTPGWDFRPQPEFGAGWRKLHLARPTRATWL